MLLKIDVPYFDSPEANLGNARYTLQPALLQHKPFGLQGVVTNNVWRPSNAWQEMRERERKRERENSFIRQ